MKPSLQVAKKYELELETKWHTWFDHDCNSLRLPGLMRSPVDIDDLCQAAPGCLWPGFMLPDSLPILGNEYGDWICARVTPENRIGELIYWYHGGGDWVPVGKNIAEAVLHDAIDQFRGIRKQMLRGASESRVDSTAGVISRLNSSDFQRWLIANLSMGEENELVQAAIGSVVSHLSTGNYAEALRVLLEHGWAFEATVCDLADVHLQLPVSVLSRQEYADELKVDWFPDYVRLLFDTELVSSRAKEVLLQQSVTLTGSQLEWPKQSWSDAAKLAEQIVSHRNDLGWAAMILGWNYEKQGRCQHAVEAYAKGMFGSSFADQSVRFNGHPETEELGKFTISRLAVLKSHWPVDLQQNTYLQTFTESSDRSLLDRVSHYWNQLAQESLAAGRLEDAYAQFYSAGWDMGVSRLGDYRPILEGLIEAARGLGWHAHRAVAEAHLSCLNFRSPPRE